ncbi:peptidase M28, partial [Corallococcus exiguus]|nr:peptidase M28 [Corallococcus exiguus]
MSPSRPFIRLAALSLALALPAPSRAEEAPPSVREREAALLMGSVLGATPMLEDLRSLVDEVGGRATG